MCGAEIVGATRSAPNEPSQATAVPSTPRRAPAPRADVPPASSTFIIPPPIEPTSASSTPGATSTIGLPDTGSSLHDERIETFVRAITDVARAHGAAETAAHAESLFKFGTPAPLALSADARAALLDGNILEATDSGIHATAWFATTSSAWQRMLRGEEGNLAVCGESTLDGWTADLIARLVAKPAMASTIRRDLRRRGIAAFGMLEA
jgi:hypothetical protein